VKADARTPRQRGQALVEFALIIPLFLLMLFGMIDLGRVIWANDDLAHAAREGARFASVTGVWSAVNPGPGCNLSLPKATCSKSDIQAATLATLAAGVQGATVTVCYAGQDPITHVQLTCSGNTDNPAGADHARGNLVTVTVSGTVPILTGSLIGFGPFPLTVSSTVLISN
jgi:hypothetical protein